MYAFFRQYEFSREHGMLYSLASPWFESKDGAYQSGTEAASDPSAVLMSVGDVDLVQTYGLYRALAPAYNKPALH